MRDWGSVLDEYEARIALQREALDRGEAGEVPPFEPPRGLGPLPERLLDRAMALVAEGADLVEELRGNVAALKQDLAVVRTIGSSTAPSGQVSHFVDTSA